MRAALEETVARGGALWEHHEVVHEWASFLARAAGAPRATWPTPEMVGWRAPSAAERARDWRVTSQLHWLDARRDFDWDDFAGFDDDAPASAGSGGENAPPSSGGARGDAAASREAAARPRAPPANGTSLRFLTAETEPRSIILV